jgi:UDP-glucose 4-epimerase
MRVLVTGGAGFVGSHVVDSLRAAGHEPRIFDLVPSPYHADGEIQTALGDLLDPNAVRAAMRGCEAVLHLGAVADVDVVVADPTRAEAVNVRGTQHVLEAAREASVYRVAYASTVWVYGSGSDDGAVAEDAPLVLPTHLYTATKLAGEMYCRSYEELYGVSHTVLRFGIPYGPRSRAAAVVAAFVARALAGEPLTIAGDGRQTRQFVYVEDLAEGCVAALAPSAAGRVYNLVRDEALSVREIAETVRELVGEVPIVHGPARLGDARIGHVSGERAAAELGWRATTGFVDGVRAYVDWLAETSGSPVARTASMIDGKAAAVFAQEPGEP